MASERSKSLLATLGDVFTGNESWRSIPLPTLSVPALGLPDALLTVEKSSVSAVHIAAGVTTLAVAGIGIKSIITMVSWRRSLRDAKTNGPAPGPPPLPFLGNVIQLRRAYYKTLYDYIDKPASVFWVLSTPFVVVNDEEGLRRVLGGAGGLYTKPKYFGYRSKAVKDAVQAERDNVAKESIEYLSDGDTSRVALENMVKDSLETIKDSMQRLLNQLEEASREAAEAKQPSEDAVSYVRKAIVGLNLDVLFGLRKGDENEEDADRISDMIGFAGTEFARRMVNPLKVLVDLPSNIRFFRDVGGLIGLGRRLCQVLDDAAQQLGGEKAADGTGLLARSTAGLSWVHAWVGKVGRIGKLGKVVGLLMASTQTVPLTAVWMLHLVGQDAAVRKQLAEELAAVGVSSARDLSYDKVEELLWADAVVRETLRLYPPFPLIQREAQRDDVVGGVRVGRGTRVYVVPWVVHRNERFWSDAHEFRPRRFVGDARRRSHGDASSDWVYLPFGRGARMCAGTRLAVTELKVLLATAVLDFEWESEREAAAVGRDERFPELGMAPDGVRLVVRRKA